MNFNNLTGDLEEKYAHTEIKKRELERIVATLNKNYLSLQQKYNVKEIRECNLITRSFSWSNGIIPLSMKIIRMNA
jgi:hypothetical protein